MGELFRRFWLPVMLAEELAERDAPPKRVTLLGEDLIIFRDSDGRIGLLDRYCAHRRADLFFGRNEECGLRCSYHGWKYDIDGKVLDMPSEPPDSPYKAHVKLKAYPTREGGGVIWAHMGNPDEIPELPQLEWAHVPAEQRYVSKRLQQSNYAQAIEGGLDSSHVSFLHRIFTEVQEQTTGKDGHLVQRPIYMIKDTRPKFYLRDTSYGFMIGARRHANDEEYYWRISQFLMPSYTIIPSAQGRPLTGHVWVPIDDWNCWAYTISWHPHRPLSDEEIEEYEAGEQIHAAVDENYRTVANRDNGYLLDRHLQATYNFTGIMGVGVQDMSVQESMGSIADRTKEHLGTSDAAIVHWRRLMLRQAQEVIAGRAEPIGACNGAAYKVRSGAMLMAKDKNVFDEIEKTLIAT